VQANDGQRVGRRLSGSRSAAPNLLVDGVAPRTVASRCGPPPPQTKTDPFRRPAPRLQTPRPSPTHYPTGAFRRARVASPRRGIGGRVPALPSGRSAALVPLVLACEVVRTPPSASPPPASSAGGVPRAMADGGRRPGRPFRRPRAPCATNDPAPDRPPPPSGSRPTARRPSTHAPCPWVPTCAPLWVFPVPAPLVPSRSLVADRPAAAAGCSPPSAAGRTADGRRPPWPAATI